MSKSTTSNPSTEVIYCECCNQSYKLSYYTRHFKTKKHLKAEALYWKDYEEEQEQKQKLKATATQINPNHEIIAYIHKNRFACSDDGWNESDDDDESDEIMKRKAKFAEIPEHIKELCLLDSKIPLDDIDKEKKFKEIWFDYKEKYYCQKNWCSACGPITW
jgi:hypothetical protein